MSTLVVGNAGVLGQILRGRLPGSGIERRHPADVLGRTDDEIARADTVVNVGGPRVRPGLGWSDYLREHVGVASLVARSMRPGTHMVHVSSASVYGSQPGPIGAGSLEAPALFPNPSYAWAKLAAEVAARAIAGERGVALSVLRLPLVYGPGVESAVDSLLRVASKGVRVELTPPAFRQHMLHSELLVNVLQRLVERGPAHQGPLVVADPFVLTNSDVTAAVARKRPRSLRVPLSVRRASAIIRHWPRFPERDVPMMLAALGALGLDVEFDWHPAFDALGLDPAAFSREVTFDAYVEAWS